MASKLRRAIGAVKDQTSISLAKVGNHHTSNLGVAVLKATTHDDVPIDDRYVYEIVQFVSSGKLSAAAAARAIGKRIGRTRDWIVALKSLLLILRIFQDGDPYFPREVLHAMKRGAKILNLSNFRDNSSSKTLDFTVFVRTFADYLHERLDCFLTGKLLRRYTTHREKRVSSVSDQHRIKSRPYEPVRNMKPAVLLDKITNWQRLLEQAIAMRPAGEAKMNILVQTCLYAIVQETFDLYKDISDGLTLLLDSFFHLQYQNCVSTYHTCVKASKQYKELGDFYALCKEIGVGRSSEYPSVQCISDELMDTLQEFLKDQSSFPATTKSPNKSPNNRPLLLLPTSNSPSSSRHSRQSSYGGQSGHSRQNSYGGRSGAQRTSLEDLITATVNGTAPSNSIDLEDYSYDQYQKQYQRDNSFRISESGSTRSLPVIHSMVDLVSLCDWPDQFDRDTNQEPLQDKPTFNAFSDSTTSSTQPPNSIWTVGLDSFDAFPEVAATPSMEFTEHHLAQPSMEFNNFSNQENISQQNEYQEASTTGWELAIVETPSVSGEFNDNMNFNYNPSPLDSLYNQPLPQSNHYNPFLQNLDQFTPPFQELQPPTFSTQYHAYEAIQTPIYSTQNHAFQESATPMFSTPTFSTQHQQQPSMGGDDPFAVGGSTSVNEQMSYESMSQHNFMKQQQLWLQNQNKIIERHMT